MSIGRNSDVISLTLEYELGAEPTRIYSIISDVHQWPDSLNPRILKSVPSTRLIAALSDFSRPEFTFEATNDGCKVTMLHDLIKTVDDKKEFRKVWNAWFKAIAKRVTQ